MKRYTHKSSAIRVAKRQFGPNWKQFCSIYGSGNSKGTWDYGIFAK